jgi:homoserine kinase type II
MSPDLEPARLAVLASYGAAVAGLRWVSLGSGGGFSGARVWRGDDPTGTPVLALKAWPESMNAGQLARVHGWMAQAAHVSFVPAVRRNSASTTLVFEAGRVWDLCRWMPGAADFETNPSPTRLANTCAAVAALHGAWPADPVRAPCPGVLNRLRILDEFRTGLAIHRGPLPPMHPALDPVLALAMEAARLAAPAAEDSLRAWAGVPFPLRPCVRDLRGDHVLFTGAEVTGIIDFGAMARDHPATDLARLLGDLAGEDDAAFTAGLAAYRDAGGELGVPDEFVRLLDRTGVVCSLLGWLRRSFLLGQTPENPAAAASRVVRLLTRLQNSCRT